MSIHIRTASNGNTPYQQRLVVDGLPTQASSYARLRLHNDTTGSYVNLNSHGGVSGGVYRSTVGTFSVSPNTTNYYRLEIMRFSTSTPTYVNTRLTSPPAPSPPSTPSVSVSSTSGRTITWRIYPGSNTTGITINRSWSSSISTSASSNSSFTWSHTASSDGRYGIRVRATGPHGTSSYSSWSYHTVTTLPAAVNASVSNIGCQSFRLNFSGGARSSTVHIQVRENSSSGRLVYSNQVSSGTSYVNVTGLDEGTTYYIRVWGSNSYGSGSASTRTASTLSTPAPSTPSVRVLSVSGRTITWRITPGSNTDRIYIDRGWSTEISTSASSWFDWPYTATRDGYFDIRVQGSGPGGLSSYSSWSGATVTTLPATVNASISNVGYQSFRVNLSGGARSSTIHVQVRENNSSGRLAFSDSVSTGVGYVNATGLKEGTTYYIRVWGSNSYGSGSASSATARTLDPIIIGNVRNLVSNNVTTSGFRVSWDSASNASSYTVQRRLRGSTSWSTYYTTSTYYSMTGLSSETYYEVRVRGYSGDFTGDWSSILTVRTESDRPTPLNWRTYRSGTDFTILTAKDWNTMTSKVNAWLEYKRLTRTTFTTAYKGEPLTAEMYNQVMRALRRLKPNDSFPLVSKGERVTASKINLIGSAVDSIT